VKIDWQFLSSAISNQPITPRIPPGKVLGPLTNRSNA